MADQTTIVAKSILFSEQVRRENKTIAAKQEAQAATITSLKSENQRQAKELAALRVQVVSAAKSIESLTTGLETIVAAHDQAQKDNEARLQHLVAELSTDGLVARLETLAEREEAVEAAVAKVGQLVTDVQSLQKNQESQLTVVTQDINELKASTSKHDDDIWGVDSRLENLKHEHEELRGKVGRCGDMLMQLDKDVPGVARRAEEAVAAVAALRTAQSSVPSTPQAASPARHVLPHVPILASDRPLASVETPHPASEFQAPQHRSLSIHRADFKALRTERASTVDSQASTQWGDAGPPDMIMPSSPPFVSPEPAHVVSEKARRLPAPNFEPRQTRTQARMLGAPSATWSRSLDSQAPLAVESSIQSHLSVDGSTQNYVSRTGLSYEPRQRTGTTPPPIKMLPPARPQSSRKRKLDGPEEETKRAQSPLSARVANTVRAKLRNDAAVAEQAQPKKVYKPNRMISDDDW